MFLSFRLHKLENQVQRLEKKITALCDSLNIETDPPRRQVRYSSPIERMGIDTQPTLILPTPDPLIARVTIDQFSFVRVYNTAGHLMPKYCGQLGKVIHTVTKFSPHIKKWETV